LLIGFVHSVAFAVDRTHDAPQKLRFAARILIMVTTWTQAVLTIIACSAIAALWAVFRPDLVRDNDGRRLPYSLTARVAFTVLFVFSYLAMAAAFLFGGFFIKSLSELMGPVPKFLQEFDNQAFVLALFASFGLYSFAPFREVERNVLSWMHDTGHLRGEFEALAAHLEDCAFNTSPEEHNRNLKSLEAAEIYITDDNARNINLESVVAWRKTASLLRRVREWNASGGPRVLSQEEMELLREIEGAHARKTRLAMDIIRIFDGIREGDSSVGALSAVTEMLSGASHANPARVAQIEAAAQAQLGNEPAPAAPRPIRITGEQLQQYLKKIEGYFMVEYRLLLSRVARLAAKSIIRAGDVADLRLDDLKSAGFEGLGSIRPLSTHRILWLFLAVAIGGFLVYYLLWYDIMLQRVKELPGVNLTEAQLAVYGQTTLIGIGFFVTTIAFAGLIGALFGSTSANARSKETPWAKYFLAGLVSILVYFLMQLIRESVVHATGLSEALSMIRPTTWVTRIRANAPWCVLPFFTTVGICWLARQKPWQPIGVLGDNGMALLQRLADGILVGVLMLPAFSIAVSVLMMVGQRLPDVLRSRFDITVMAILAVLGFIVGATVVRDVRTAAHTRVVLPKLRRKEEARAPLAVARPAM
jgi:hypothetical protein